MSTAPIDRDRQIELMSSAKERHEKLMQKWTSDPTLRRAIAEPISTSRYSREDLPVAKCV